MYWFATCNFFASKEKETAIVHRENVAGCRHSRPKRQMRRNINEPELVNRIIGGDSRAMKELYDSHVGFLMAAASRYIPDDDDVKDVLQESFVKIYTSISKFNYRGDGSLRAWMTRIVVNEAIDFLDRNKRNGGVSAGEPAAEEIEDEYDEPDAGQVPIEVIHDMIRRLPEGYREADRQDAAGFSARIYTSEDGGMISFTCSQGTDAASLFLISDTAALLEAEVNGLPADYYREPDPDSASALVWMSADGGTMFCLTGALPEETLIRIAESVPAAG